VCRDPGHVKLLEQAQSGHSALVRDHQADVLAGAEPNTKDAAVSRKFLVKIEQLLALAFSS
jgi:hypothetical protein